VARLRGKSVEEILGLDEKKKAEAPAPAAPPASA
jgi:ribosomal protein L12E/L44/L45/RPP1/RPP2